jgi:hypothetical protein
MRVTAVLLTVGAAFMAADMAEAQKGKPGGGTTIVNWRCDVVMRDGPGDAITSDFGRTGELGKEYVDGVGAFTCGMSPMESADAGNPAPGSASFYFGRNPTRSFFFPARSGSWAASYDTSLQVRVFSLVDMSVGTHTHTRAMAIPTSVIGAMYADNPGPVTDLVTVVRTDECTWIVTFEAPSAKVERYTSLDRKRLIDTPQLPLGFTLTTRAPVGSNISACPAVP